MWLMLTEKDFRIALFGYWCLAVKRQAHASDAAHVIEVAAHVQGLTSKRQRPPDGESGVGRVYDLLVGHAHRNASDVTSLVGAGRLAGLVWTLGRPFFASPRRGASTIVYLATSEEGGEVTGGYYENSRPASTSAAAADIELADDLWRESERLVGLEPRGSR